MGRITGSQDIMKRKADKPQAAGTVLTPPIPTFAT